MSIRSEIETKLLDFAASQTPAIPVAIEGVRFVKPATGCYLELHLLDQPSVSRNVAASGKRVTGAFQIDCYAPANGSGMGELEALRDAIFELYPVVPKMELVSIERPLSATRAYPIGAFICLHITGQYRVEL